MKDLKVGQQVFAGYSDSGLFGKRSPIYETVYGFGHHSPDKVVEYLRITTAPSGKRPLEISGSHLVFVNGKKDPVRADSLQVGDELLHKSMDSGATKPTRITKMETIMRRGLYQPLTKDGTIVVNDILASTYVSILEDAPEVVTKYLTVVSEDQLLHWWLAPYRMVCQGMPSLCHNDKDSEGVAYWLVFGRYLAKLANGWGFVSQMVGLVVVGLFMAFSMGVEAFVMTFCNVPGALAGLTLAGLTKKALSWKAQETAKKMD